MIVSAPPVNADTLADPLAVVDPWTIGRSPLVWVAGAATLGVIVDRIASPPMPVTIGLAAGGLAAWLVSRHVTIAALLVTIFALAATRHHLEQRAVVESDLARLASPNGTPVSLRGRLVAPVILVPTSDDPLFSIPRVDTHKMIVDVEALLEPEGSRLTSGRVVAYTAALIETLDPGDEIEMLGRLVSPRTPGNPGEFDVASDLRDRGVAAILSVPASNDAIRLVARRWPTSLTGWLAGAHQACKNILRTMLTHESDLATALLLGDGTVLPRSSWDKFRHSGVVHALAISGQHLFVLATFLALLRRIFFIRLVPATIAIVGILLAYALLTGGRPPALRAAWMVAVAGLAILCRRQPSTPNAFAFAWIGVILVNPNDIFQTGCQLSFLAVALLVGVVPAILQSLNRRDPIDRLDSLAQENSIVPAFVRRAAEWLCVIFLSNAIIWIGVTPLIADRYQLVSPIALLVGPPVVLLASIALVAGFLLILATPIFGFLAMPFAWVVDGSLWMCEWIIDLGLRVPGASFSVVEIPTWWTVAFYLGLTFAVFFHRSRRPGMPIVVASLVGAWLVLGVVLGLGILRRAEFRVTFLSVGHGGCTVVETDAGRVFIYDAGAIGGPEVVRRVILPYLAARRIRRIDDLFLSHADLDHFTGVPDLIDQVAVARVTLTPSFADRTTPGVRRVLDHLHRFKIPTRILKAGDSESFDDLRLDILHPPAVGPEGTENARSLVMLVGRKAFTCLLTGDLEGVGLERVLSLRRTPVEILMAPHHGSRLANPTALAAWSTPRLVISSQGRPRGSNSPAPAYEALGARYLTTHHEGAITIRSIGDQYQATTFRTQKTLPLLPGRVR